MDARFRQRLALPFFDSEHRELANALHDWCNAQSPVSHHDADAGTREWVRRLGSAGFLAYTVPKAFGGVHAVLDSRSLCIARESLAYHDGLADFAFAMQGLGAGPLTLEGPTALQQEWLPKVGRGEAIAAFALSEPDAGSDVGAMTSSAELVGAEWVLRGTKTWISNGGIADFYTVVARTDPSSIGAKGLTAFFVPATTPGLHIVERLAVTAPHPLAALEFRDCRIPEQFQLGAIGDGFKLAMRTLDIFRTSVAAAALGFSRRALHEAEHYATQRTMFGGVLADQPVTQSTLGELHTEFDAAALLTARAAWLRDVGGDSRATSEAAMAKLAATESGQRIVDLALQMHGARGVLADSTMERLYREIRALRIYEGASEVQRLIIGRHAFTASRAGQ